MTKAEDRKNSEEGFLVENEALQLDIKQNQERAYSGFDRTGLASLAIERAIGISSVITQCSICFNHALAHCTAEVSNLGQTAGVSVHSMVEHDEGDVQNTGDGNDGGVTQSSELTQKRRREDDEHSGND